MARKRRLFVPELPAAGGGVTLPRESIEHVHVLRLAVGAELELFDAHGRQAAATLATLARDRVECLAEPATLANVRGERLTLVVCLPKAAQLESIVRMSTELGVSQVHLASSERTVPKLAPDGSKLERLRRIAREACAQSGAARPPALLGPAPLATCVAAAPDAAVKLAFWERATAPLPAAGSGAFSCPEVWAVIGPEGGLSDAEAAQLEAAGFTLTSLGTHILRAETACVVIAALLLDRMRAFGV